MSAATKTSSGSASGPTPSIAETFGFNRYRFTAPKILLIVAAVAMIVVGLFGSPGKPTGSTTSQAETGASIVDRSFAPNSGNSLAQPFVDSFPAPSSTNPQSAVSNEDRTFLEQWSPSLVRGGFSMFIGFAIGYAIRAFLRLATIIAGVYFLILTLMAWAGWVEIHWSVIEGQFDQMVSTLETQFASFKAFLMGSIPSAGLGAAGLASGLRQK